MPATIIIALTSHRTKNIPHFVESLQPSTVYPKITLKNFYPSPLNKTLLTVLYNIDIRLADSSIKIINLIY